MAVKEFIKKNIVMVIALFAAIITSFIVIPDKEYFGYFDFKTLSCLFCVLAVVCALKNINFFYILAKKVVAVFKNTQNASLALCYITFIGSMLIANDMALLTFLPLGYFVLKSGRKTKGIASKVSQTADLLYYEYPGSGEAGRKYRLGLCAGKPMAEAAVQGASCTAPGGSAPGYRLRKLLCGGCAGRRIEAPHRADRGQCAGSKAF